MSFAQFIEQAAGFMWGRATIYFLLGTGILFTILLKVPQRRIGDSIRLVFGKNPHHDEKNITAWEAICTCIGGQVGTGNIVGPATSIIAGGPGALFWCWMSAIFGQAIIFAEAVAAQKHREKLPDGTYNGGVSYYIKAAFPGSLGKILATIFALLLLVGYGWGCTLVNTNAITDAVYNAYGVSKLVTAIIVAIVVLLVVVGGLKRIANVMSSLVPIMSLVYIGCGLVLILMNIDQFLPALGAIFVAAFTPKAVLGGAVGFAVQKAMRYGLARGLLSNEAGMGSTPQVHAVADVKNPCDQGLVSMFSVMVDTLIILTMSGLVMLTVGAQNAGLSGVAVVQYAFSQVFGSTIGNLIIVLAVACFCFTTMCTGFYYGQSAMIEMFGQSKAAFAVLAIVEPFLIVLGGVMPLDVAWNTVDCFYAAMVWINLCALWKLIKSIRKDWIDYEKGGRTLDTTLNDIKNHKAKTKA